MAEPIARPAIPDDGHGLTTSDGRGGDLLAPLLPAGEPVEQLLRKAQFFVPGGTPSPDFRNGDLPMSNTSTGQILVWVALPYLALGIFVVGHVWRWRYDQFGWTSRSSGRRWRKIGVPY